MCKGVKIAKDIYLISNKKKYLKGNVICYRCGRHGHYATRCKNKTTKDGYRL